MSNDLRAPEFLRVVEAHGVLRYRMLVGWDKDFQRITTYTPPNPSFTAIFYHDNTEHKTTFGAIQLFHPAFRDIEQVKNEEEVIREVRWRYFTFVPPSPQSIPPALATPEDGEQRRAISPSLSSRSASDSSGDKVELLQKMLEEAVTARATLEGENLRKDVENDYLKQIIVRISNSAFMKQFID